jgi:hypothetical protein
MEDKQVIRKESPQGEAISEEWTITPPPPMEGGEGEEEEGDDTLSCASIETIPITGTSFTPLTPSPSPTEIYREHHFMIPHSLSLLSPTPPPSPSSPPSLRKEGRN